MKATDTTQPTTAGDIALDVPQLGTPRPGPLPSRRQRAPIRLLLWISLLMVVLVAFILNAAQMLSLSFHLAL